jgi:hypothetical protein
MASPLPAPVPAAAAREGRSPQPHPPKEPPPEYLLRRLVEARARPAATSPGADSRDAADASDDESDEGDRRAAAVERAGIGAELQSRHQELRVNKYGFLVPATAAATAAGGKDGVGAKGGSGSAQADAALLAVERLWNRMVPPRRRRERSVGAR